MIDVQVNYKERARDLYNKIVYEYSGVEPDKVIELIESEMVLIFSESFRKAGESFNQEIKDALEQVKGITDN